MSSAFDPAIFLDAIQSEVNERRSNLPEENPATEDGYYIAVVGEITPKSGTIGKGDQAGQPWVGMAIQLKIEVPQQLQDSLKLPKVITLTDNAFLDLTPEGNVDNSPGKNRFQKLYREAINKNNPGDTFAWRMLTGQPLKVKIKHEIYQDQVVEKVGGIFRA